MYIRDEERSQCYRVEPEKSADGRILHVASPRERGVFPFRHHLRRKTLLQRVHTAQQCSVLLQSYARRGHHLIPRTRAPGPTEGRLLRIVNGPSHILLPHPQRNSLPVHCPSLDFLSTLIATFLPNQGACHRWMPSRHRHRIQDGPRVLSARYNCGSAT